VQIRKSSDNVTLQTVTFRQLNDVSLDGIIMVDLINALTNTIINVAKQHAVDVGEQLDQLVRKVKRKLDGKNRQFNDKKRRIRIK
jgi:hypothetical protein